MLTFSRIARIITKDLLLSWGIIILFVIISSIILAPYLYKVPFDRIDISQANLTPSWDHLFGTNDLGQDQLARVLLGGRISLTVALAAV